MARVKPTEIRLVADLLMQEAPDAEGLARTIIESLDEKRAQEAGKQPPYCVVYYEPNTVTLSTYGPFSTEKQAERLVKSLVSPGPKRAHVWRTKLYGEVRHGG